MTAFLDAVRTGDVRTVQSLLGVQPGLATSHDEAGASAVLIALDAGHDRVVDALLDAGADLDVFEAAALGRSNELDILLGLDPDLLAATTVDGVGPLHLAARYGHAEAVTVLLAHGADPIVPTAGGLAAAELARAGGHDDVAELIDAAVDQ